MINDNFLSQDIDILPEATWGNESASVADIIPESPAPVGNTEPEKKEEVTPTEGDAELEELLAWVSASTNEVSDNVDTVTETIEEVKGKVEEAQWNPEGSDEMLKEIYQDLLKTETALQATEIAKDVALSKVSELQAQVSELEINAAGNYQTDNPDLLIVNKLLGAAEGWSDIASPKVKDALNKLYLSLFNTSIEDWQVQDNVDWIDNQWISLNEGTLPAGNIDIEAEPTDINDVTAIFW